MLNFAENPLQMPQHINLQKNQTITLFFFFFFSIYSILWFILVSVIFSAFCCSLSLLRLVFPLITSFSCVFNDCWLCIISSELILTLHTYKVHSHTHLHRWFVSVDSESCTISIMGNKLLIGDRRRETQVDVLMTLLQFKSMLFIKFENILKWMYRENVEKM